MRPTVTAILMLVASVILTPAGVFGGAALTSEEPSQFFNAYLVAFVLITGFIGGVFIGAAAIASWSVVSAFSRPVRAIGTGGGTLLAAEAVGLVTGVPSDSVATSLSLFLAPGILVAISTAIIAALARRRVPQRSPGPN